jgi:hypothetical protein
MGKKRGGKQKPGVRNSAIRKAGRNSGIKRGAKRSRDRSVDEEQLVTVASSRKFKPIKRRRRKQVKLGEALRKAGLDEQTVAETYVGVVEVLREQTTREPGRKLLVDVLKECSRVLEPPRGPGANANELPTIVELHHEMSRPERERKDAPEEGFEKDADELDAE